MTASMKLIDGQTKTGTMERQKALEAALAQIDRAFGKGSAMRLGSKEAMQIEAISTGSLGLDIALGIGGLPRGRIVEIYGPESSGKTTLALHAIAEAQKAGGTAAFVDAEPGSTITVALENEGSATHTFTVDGTDVDQKLDPGDKATVTLTVPESGALTFFCKFHKASGMQGAILAGGTSGAPASGGDDTPTSAAADPGY